MPAIPFQGLASKQVTSTGTSDVQTITLDPTARLVYLSCRTSNAYWTLDGTSPSSVNGGDLVAGANPFLLVCGSGTTLKIASASGSCAVNAVPLA